MKFIWQFNLIVILVIIFSLSCKKADLSYNVTGVEINPSIKSLILGNTDTLKATISPSNASNLNVKWTTSDSTIVNVNSLGIIHGFKTGVASITVATIDGNFNSICKVTVINSITGITLLSNNLILVGETNTLIPKVIPSNVDNSQIIWTSSNIKVGTVNLSGIVTGISPGTTTITAATSDGLISSTCLLTVSNWKAITHKDGLANDLIAQMLIDYKGNHWYCTNAGVSKFDGVKWTTYNTSNGLQNNIVESIVQDKDSSIWIGCGGVLSKFDGKNWINYSPDKMGTYRFISLAIDNAGNKWIGTYGDGLYKFDGSKWTYYNSGNSKLGSNSVLSIYIDKQGTKWLGTWPGGYTTITADFTWAVYNTSNCKLPDNYVTNISSDNDGNIWFGTVYGGAAKFDGINWTIFDTTNGLKSNNVYSIVKDKQNNLWFGTKQGGLSKFDGTSWVNFNTINSGLSNDLITSVTIDDKSNKWITTVGGGIFEYHE